MELSICIIAKNEQNNIENCLSHIVEYGAEIVVVDTGSTDNTKSLVRKYTNNLYDYKWNDDFGAAKQFAVSKAKYDNILILDCDEFLVKSKENYNMFKKLETQLKQQPNKVGRIKRINILGEQQEIDNNISTENQRSSIEWINRAFNRNYFMVYGKIHEQIISKNNTNVDTFLTDITIKHTGYALTLEEKKKKAKRNLDLLKKRLEELDENNEETPYILYQIGKSYYMSEDYCMAYEYFSKGLSYDLNPKLEYVIDMVETYGYSMLNSGKIQEAMSFTSIYDEFGNSADFKFLMGLIYMKNGIFEKAVNEFEKACKCKECRVIGTNSYMAYYNIGVIYECLGDIVKAKDYYSKCGNYAQARVRLDELNK